jgi:heptaprenyl diphosphate synthase
MHETVGPQEDEDRVAFYLQVLSDKTGSLIAAAAQAGVIFSNGPREFEDPLVVFGEKAGVAFQLLDDVLDLSADPQETGKVPGTDLRAGVPTMPYLVLGQRTDDASVELRGRIDDGVGRIEDGADPAVLDDALSDLRDHPATQTTLDLAHAWSREAVDALQPLPDGAVREALTRFAQAVVDRSS